MGFIYVDKTFIDQLKTHLHRGSPPYDGIRHFLQQKAETSMEEGPWAITDYPSPAASGDPHDYFSEGPYWWPDPDDPDGPYIRRDGEVNPDHFTTHRRALTRLSRAVMALSFAGYYLDRPTFSRRAAHLLRVWFLDEKTRMNPHLEYGQAIRGRVEGRGIGIIDTNCLIGLVFALPFLEASGWKSDDRDGIRRWLRQYVTWLTESEKGLDEKSQKNNHGTYWAAQVGTFAAYIGDRNLLNTVFRIYRDKLLPDQVEADGGQPKEEIRTISLSYSVMNANGLALLCELGHQHGVDLWRYETAHGACIEAVASYLAPYVEKPSTWPKNQIKPFRSAPQLFLQWAALRLNVPVAPMHAQLDSGHSVLGPLSLLPK